MYLVKEVPVPCSVLLLLSMKDESLRQSEDGWDFSEIEKQADQPIEFVWPQHFS